MPQTVTVGVEAGLVTSGHVPLPDLAFARTVRYLGDAMSYDLHITRREFWADDEGTAITFDDWAAYVETDQAITPAPENPSRENYLLRYRQHSLPLWWDKRGEVYTSNPEPEVIAKLVQIASALGARVLGDDGEVYGSDPSNPAKPLTL